MRILTPTGKHNNPVPANTTTLKHVASSTALAKDHPLRTHKTTLLNRKRQLENELKVVRDAQRNLETVLRYQNEQADDKLETLVDKWKAASRAMCEELKEKVMERAGGAAAEMSTGMQGGDDTEQGGTRLLLHMPRSAAAAFDPFQYDPDGTDLHDMEEEARRRQQAQAEAEDDFYNPPAPVAFTMKLMLQTMGVDIEQLGAYDEENDCFEED
jgi:hypothetical protein